MPQATNHGIALSPEPLPAPDQAPDQAPDPARPGRADDLAGALTAAVAALKRGIGDPEAGARAFLLGHVARLAPVRATDLAEHVHLDLSTISRHLRALEESGLLERSPDPDDRRASLLTVTPEGSDVLVRATAARSALFTSATSRWTDAEVDELVRLLHRLSDDLETQ